MRVLSGAGRAVGRLESVGMGTDNGLGEGGFERFRFPVMVWVGAAVQGRLGGGAVVRGARRQWGRLVVLRSVAGLRGRLGGVVVVGGASRLWGHLVGAKWVRMSGRLSWRVFAVGGIVGSGEVSTMGGIVWSGVLVSLGRIEGSG